MIGIKESVTLQKRVAADDDYGTETATWSDSLTFKATFSTVSSSELMQADRTQAQFTHRLYIDYHKARTFAGEMDGTARFKIGSDYYDIVGIEHHFRRLTVVLLSLSV